MGHHKPIMCMNPKWQVTMEDINCVFLLIKIDRETCIFEGFWILWWNDRKQYDHFKYLNMKVKTEDNEEGSSSDRNLVMSSVKLFALAREQGWSVSQENSLSFWRKMLNWKLLGDLLPSELKLECERAGIEVSQRFPQCDQTLRVHPDRRVWPWVFLL